MTSTLRFVPYHDLGDTPNVIVDGSPIASTRLTLSHWPGAPTPPELRRDLSAEIAADAADAADIAGLFDGIEAVSNNHFDQDGLMSAFALVQPDEARRRRGQLIDVARAGDFGTFGDRDSMRIAFALAAHDDPARSPLGADLFDGSYEVSCGRLYQALLPCVAEMLDHPHSLRALWEDEDAHLGESIDAINSGAVDIHELPDVDLAVVTVPESFSDRMTTRFTVARTDAVHPAAVNNATDMLRVLTVHGRSYRLELRYETWVMLVSRPVMPRPDLRPIAEALTEKETGDAVWTGQTPGGLTPALTHTDNSSIPPEQIAAILHDLLAAAPAAWNPFAAG